MKATQNHPKVIMTMSSAECILIAAGLSTAAEARPYPLDPVEACPYLQILKQIADDTGIGRVTYDQTVRKLKIKAQS